MEKTPPNLDEVEQQIQAEILGREGKTIRVTEDLLNQHLAGFSEIGPFTISEDNGLEQVWILLTNRAFNSLRWAFHLLTTGYYSQSPSPDRQQDQARRGCRWRLQLRQNSSPR